MLLDNLVGLISINAIDISLLVTITSVLSYFFGRLYIETRGFKDETFSTSVHGFLLLILFIILPLSLLYYISEYLLSFISLWWGLLIIQIVLLWFLNKRKQVGDLERSDLIKTFLKTLRNNFTKILASQDLSKGAVQVFQKIYQYPLPPWFMILLSFVSVTCFFFVLTSEVPIFIKTISFLLFFACESLIVTLKAWYDQSNSSLDVTVLVSNFKIKKLSGKLLGIQNNYVKLFANGLVYYLPENSCVIVADPKNNETKKSIKKINL